MADVIDLHRKQEERNLQRPSAPSGDNSTEQFFNKLYGKGIISRVPYEELDKVLQAGGLCLGVDASGATPVGIIMRDD